MTNPSSISWTMFIFCYNEEHTVGNVIEQAVRVCEKLSEGANEILVVNDGSTDHSKEVIESKCLEHVNVRAIHHPKNLGIGAALISGYSNAKGACVCGIPADGQFNPEEILPFKNHVAGEVVCFVREEKRYNAYRNLLSTFNNFINKLLLGLALQDVNWVKVYHSDDLKGIKPKMRSSLIESEMCAMLKVRGAEFVEVPSVYHERTAGETKGGSLKTVGMAALEFTRLVVRVNLFRFRLVLRNLFLNEKRPDNQCIQPATKKDGNSITR